MDQPLPSDAQAERALLSSILHAPAKVIPACEERGLADDWWSNQEHARIYQGFRQMLKENRPIDLVTVGGYFQDHKSDLGLYSANIHATLVELFTLVPTATSWAYYLERIQEKAALRLGVIACMKTQEALQQPLSVQETYDLTTKAFQRTHEVCVTVEEKDWDGEALLAFIENMERIAAGGKNEAVLKTYLPSLDEESGGMMPGEVYIVHGLTSTYKSTLSQFIVQENAMVGKRGAIFSLEMSHADFLARLTASIGKISMRSMRTGQFSQVEMDRFVKTAMAVKALPLSIFDIKRNALTDRSIITEIRRMKRNGGLSCACIDYLQLVKFSTKAKSEVQKYEQMQAFSTDLKRLSQELDIVTILVAQANEAGSTFGSSQVESDADGVLTMLPDYKDINGKKKVIGCSGVWVQKFRAARRGWRIPVITNGQMMSIQEDVSYKEPVAAF